MKTVYWTALILAIFFNVVSNTALKKSMIDLTGDRLRSVIPELLMAPIFWIGIVSAGLLLSFYLIALRGLPLSLAYATVTSMAMVGLMFTGAMLFGETMSAGKILGTVLVVSGVFILARTA